LRITIQINILNLIIFKKDTIPTQQQQKMITASIGIWMALFPLLLISAADAANPYGVPPPMHPHSPQWQRPATQWDANGRQQWMGEKNWVAHSKIREII
jgi:hypothetical protein